MAMKKLETTKTKNKGMVHINQTQKKAMAQGYNPVHGIRKEEPKNWSEFGVLVLIYRESG
jgi:hypothetical protein